MDRRDFLRGMGLAAAGPLLAACARTFRIPLSEMAQPAGGPGGEKDPDGLWREGLAYARWAPSPHNVQPWRLRLLAPDRAELYYDPRRLLPKTDPTSAFTLAGLAMFADYLSFALRPRGYEVLADRIARPLDYSATRPTLFARLLLVPFRGDAAWDRNLILQRKTSRLPYDGKPVEDEALQALAGLARAQGHDFSWSSEKAMVDWTLDLNRFTLFSDLDDPVTRGELRGWIRCSDEEAARKKDGLWSQCMRFPGWLLRDFFDKHNRFEKGWRRDLCGKMLVHGMAGTRTVAWWSGPFDGPEDWMRCGTLLGQSWLELTRRGISLHPFGSIITNRSAHARLQEKLGAQEGPKRLWLLVRMGRSDVPPRSYRVDEPTIFLDDKELA